MWRKPRKINYQRDSVNTKQNQEETQGNLYSIYAGKTNSEKTSCGADLQTAYPSFDGLCMAIWRSAVRNHARKFQMLVKEKFKGISGVSLSKAKAVPLHAMKVLEGRRYSSYSFTTSALERGEWLASRPGRALAPGWGPPVPTVQEAGWVPEPVWTQRLEKKSFASAGDRTSIARSSSP
jgi:hypothetical protein